MYVCILYGRELVHPLCAGSREPVKTPEMGPGVGVACERRDGERGEERNGRERRPRPPHPTSKPGSVRQEKKVLCSCPNAAYTLAAPQYVRWSFSESSGGVLFSFWSAVAASPERRVWAKCWIRRPAFTHSPVTAQLFARGARPAAVLIDGAEAYVR